jgi:hypothetical protein
MGLLLLEEKELILVHHRWSPLVLLSFCASCALVRSGLRAIPAAERFFLLRGYAGWWLFVVG